MNFLSPEETTKAPFRGFSALTVTENPAAVKATSSLAARFLNTPHDLQASIATIGFTTSAVIRPIFSVLCISLFWKVTSEALSAYSTFLILTSTLGSLFV